MCVVVVGTVDELAPIKFQVCLAGEDKTVIREGDDLLGRQNSATGKQAVAIGCALCARTNRYL